MVNRRTFLKEAGLVFGGGMLLPGCLSRDRQSESLQNKGVEVMSDPQFIHGFHLVDPELRNTDYALWQPREQDLEPAWKLVQWNTRERVSPTKDFIIQNSYKEIAVATSGRHRDLVLSVNGNAEYQGIPRTGNEPWVHLLVEQEIVSMPTLTSAATLPFHLEARLLKSQLFKSELFDAGKHAAQYQVFFYLQNKNKESKSYGELIWFGIPVYDNRMRYTERYEAQDFAGSGMFICTLAHTDLSADSAHDEKWITLQGDLLPKMKEAFTIAQQKGFMQNANLEDIHISGMNMGWEVPGLLDVSLQIRNLSLRYVTNPSFAIYGGNR